MSAYFYSFQFACQRTEYLRTDERALAEALIGLADEENQ